MWNVVHASHDPYTDKEADAELQDPTVSQNIYIPTYHWSTLTQLLTVQLLMSSTYIDRIMSPLTWWSFSQTVLILWNTFWPRFCQALYIFFPLVFGSHKYSLQVAGSLQIVFVIVNNEGVHLVKVYLLLCGSTFLEKPWLPHNSLFF
jgi:hypothetical protein